MNILAGYTPEYDENSDKIVTTCIFEGPQSLVDNAITLDYECTWTSNAVNVSRQITRFRNWINNNAETILRDIQAQEIMNIVGVGQVSFRTLNLTPTIAPVTEAPSLAPTISNIPSMIPSDAPSIPLATFAPTEAEPVPAPTNAPNVGSGDSGLGAGAIVGLVIGIGIVVLVLLVCLYRHRQVRRRTLATGATATSLGTGNLRRAYGDDQGTDVGVAGMISPAESLLSGKSLLSAPEPSFGPEESFDEADNTKYLQDEFDKYKDQNLEEFRIGVEDNVSDFEGIMSAAVTNALMGGPHEPVDREEITWGFRGNPTGMEIEASALCEVHDWMKRNENATDERKRVFMQEVLNKMVTSVRYGVLPAGDGSRAIHESAALLGLSLASHLPQTTVLVMGMRKTVSAPHVIKALREFGDIDAAAVASRQRGFGIVRFRNPKSADRAMRRYQSGEIVVQDVAVQMKVLTPSGAVESG